MNTVHWLSVFFDEQNTAYDMRISDWSSDVCSSDLGHNWVLSHASDESGVLADGMKAGAANSYEKPGDARIIAHTKLIGGGQSDTTTINVSKLKAGEQYAFFCTFRTEERRGGKECVRTCRSRG